MNKKIFSRILISSALTISISAAAVSCYTEPKTTNNNPITPIEKPSLKPDITPPKVNSINPEEKLKNELNSEVNKVTVNYHRKNKTPASKLFNPWLDFSGFDEKKFKISLIGITPDDRRGNAVVKFKLLDIKDEKNQSEEKEITIEGFKKVPISLEKLSEMALKIQLDYFDKEDVYIWDVKTENVVFKNFPDDTSVSKIKFQELYEDEAAVLVTFLITDNYDTSTKTYVKYKINGFKSVQKNETNLTKTLFNDTNKFIQLDRKPLKKLSLYKELVKPKAEITFNFNSNKIVIPAEKKEVNLSKPETYIEIGSLSPTYTTVNNELMWEVAKLIKETFVADTNNIFGTISKILTQSKEDALKEFETLKPKLSDAKTALSTHVNYVGNFDEVIEQLINKENFSVVYNPKTAMFSIQSGETEIDLNKPSTFTNFVGFEKELKEKIILKIKEILTKHNVDINKIDLFLNDADYNLSFIFQKSGTNLIIGLKVKQIRKPII